jgi:hypothetical protein
MYEPTQEERDRVKHNFTYHPPHGDQAKRYESIRLSIGDVASYLQSVCPQSRELSLALTKLEEAGMWANAAIARNEKQG